jgi:hypothetical protein
MDQRKLMDNANTITDMAKTQNTVYEIVSDMSTRQDALEERITSLEEKIQTVQVTESSRRSCEMCDDSLERLEGLSLSALTCERFHGLMPNTQTVNVDCKLPIRVTHVTRFNLI